MSTEEIIKIMKSKRRAVDYESIRQAFYYRLFKYGLNGCDIASIFDISKWSAYHDIYAHRDRLEIADVMSTRAENELNEHDVKVDIIIERLKIQGYIVLVDGVELARTNK